MFFGGGQNELGIHRGLFEGFKESIESSLREHVNFINNIYFVFYRLGRYAHLFHKGANIFNGVVGCGIKLVNIERSRSFKSFA
ncbi:MAG: hypothetical protein BWY70_01219 [Bacteroidetes bacterium ADurb.Bin408]|nr:MAG: hypothetical protein BWY70_01219 [Bacteroidetes bacterium ADurb.Bin408]